MLYLLKTYYKKKRFKNQVIFLFPWFNIGKNPSDCLVKNSHKDLITNRLELFSTVKA